jgi:hypothetical protein
VWAWGDPASARKGHRNRVFGRRADVAFWCICDDHAVVGGGLDVDVVDADARAADDDEIFGGFEDRLVDIGARADDQCVGVGDRIEQFVAFCFVVRLDLVACFTQPIEPRIVDRVRDEYLHICRIPRRLVKRFHVDSLFIGMYYHTRKPGVTAATYPRSRIYNYFVTHVDWPSKQGVGTER